VTVSGPGRVSGGVIQRLLDLDLNCYQMIFGVNRSRPWRSAAGTWCVAAADVVIFMCGSLSWGRSFINLDVSPSLDKKIVWTLV